MTTKTWTVRSAEDLGRAIGDLRRAHNMTQAELASQTGLSRSWLAKLEVGSSSAVLDHLLRLVRRLGGTVTVTWEQDRG